MRQREDFLVTTDWLKNHLSAPDLVILDASWHLPSAQRDARAEYHQEHIPNALFFDIDDIADDTCDLPHMLPSPAKFSSRMRRMGIGDGKRVAVYDSTGIACAARCWWTFWTMGHHDVVVLDGGLPKWKADGGEVESFPPAPVQPRHYTARRNAGLVRDIDDMIAIIEGRDPAAPQIVDARSKGRFAGSEPEPRDGLRGGRIPGSISLPYDQLLNGDGTYKSDDGIKAAFEAAGVDLAKPIVTTCGSGVTAAALALALEVIGHHSVAVYDGSWAEWGARDDVPVETG